MLIVATGSKYKQQLMQRLGIAFEARAADIDETALASESPAQTARRLAREKALEVAGGDSSAWVLGADQIIALEGDRLTKPGTPQRAFEQLRALAGRTHRLLTAVALVGPGGNVYEDEVEFAMRMRDLTDEQIRAYVSEDEPLDCAGSYRIEAAGIRLFRSLRGDDYTAIIGLPLTRVWDLLQVSGYLDANPCP